MAEIFFVGRGNTCVSAYAAGAFEVVQQTAVQRYLLRYELSAVGLDGLPAVGVSAMSQPI